MGLPRILILGCGYTGRRVAREFVSRGNEVVATTRSPETLAGLGTRILPLDLRVPGWAELVHEAATPGTRILISIPTIQGADPVPELVQAVSRASRTVYLSTTGVYGKQAVVDANSQPAPVTQRELARFTAEQAISQAPGALILRPAAIYGPYRGIHTSMRDGKYRLMGSGGNYVSRIHVDDLAAHCVAGLLSDCEGAWPVADEEPCTSLEIAEFCARLLDLPLPASVDDAELSETRRADRRVDGSAIRQELGITLRFPSYRLGIPACIEAEAEERAF